MKRIGLSQRCDPVPGRDEIRDGLDVRLAAMLWDLGFLPVPLASALADPVAYLDALGLDGLMLTGGADIGTTPGRDRLERAGLDLAAARGLPVFALCRGMQMLNHACGGHSTPRPGHVATRHLVQDTRGRGWQMQVNSYHNQCIPPEGLGRGLQALALAEDGTIEALRHDSLPWLGVMWHPERDSPTHADDLRLIRDHLNGDPTWQEPSSLPPAWEHACGR